jgi:hypothetical protein
VFGGVFAASESLARPAVNPGWLPIVLERIWGSGQVVMGFGAQLGHGLADHSGHERTATDSRTSGLTSATSGNRTFNGAVLDFTQQRSRALGDGAGGGATSAGSPDPGRWTARAENSSRRAGSGHPSGSSEDPCSQGRDLPAVAASLRAG